MSSFFTLPASRRKRKRPDSSAAPARKKRSPTRQDKTRDDSISGSDSDGQDTPRPGENGSLGSADDSEDEEQETAGERRLRLAERYLDNIRAEVGEEQQVGFDAADVDRELIAARLKEDVDEEKGKLFRRVAGNLAIDESTHTFFGADTLATNAVAACPPFIYTASKDMKIIKWILPPTLTSPMEKSSLNGTNRGTRRKPKQLLYSCGRRSGAQDKSRQHHSAAILCIAASSDGKFVVTGGADKLMIVWDASTLKPLKVFSQHRDAVTALAFRGKTNQLFSGSKDRSVKVWSLDELAYVETLYGHQDEVLDVAAIGGPHERCISVGARDRTARLWKVVEESQLVFRGGGGGGRGGGGGGGGGGKKSEMVESESEQKLTGASTGMNGGPVNGGAAALRFNEGSLERVIQITSQLFVTGSDSGALSLFSLNKKKPLHVMPLAHGVDPKPTPSEWTAETNPTQVDAGPSPRWITALACISFTDLFVSGSWDGCVRVWRISEDQRRIESVGVLRDTDAEIEILDDATEPPNARRRGMRVVNDLSVFEIGERGKGGACIVAGVGNETRLGRWKKLKGKNGAFLFHIPRRLNAATTREE